MIEIITSQVLRHHELVNRYDKSMSQLATDIFQSSYIMSIFPFVLITDYVISLLWLSTE